VVLCSGRLVAVSEPLDLEPIKDRAAAAWPERWVGTSEAIGYYDDGRWFTLARMAAWEGPRVDGPNAEFIAHAREDVPALIAEVERLRVEMDEMHHESRGMSE
jgi:hypothetical protein